MLKLRMIEEQSTDFSADVVTASFVTSVHVETNVHLFDTQRMSKALASESISIPMGLSREEKRQFILKHSK